MNGAPLFTHLDDEAPHSDLMCVCALFPFYLSMLRNIAVFLMAPLSFDLFYLRRQATSCIVALKWFCVYAFSCMSVQTLNGAVAADDDVTIWATKIWAILCRLLASRRLFSNDLELFYVIISLVPVPSCSLFRSPFDRVLVLLSSTFTSCFSLNSMRDFCLWQHSIAFIHRRVTCVEHIGLQLDVTHLHAQLELQPSIDTVIINSMNSWCMPMLMRLTHLTFIDFTPNDLISIKITLDSIVNIIGLERMDPFDKQ